MTGIAWLLASGVSDEEQQAHHQTGQFLTVGLVWNQPFHRHARSAAHCGIELDNA